MTSLNRLQKPVLVLNASYEPINICAARRALVLVLKGVASAEEESTQHIHSARAGAGVEGGGVGGGGIHAAHPLGAQCGEAAERDSTAGIPAHPAPDAGAFAQEHSDARPLHVPVLPSHAAFVGVDAGPRGAAVARGR